MGRRKTRAKQQHFRPVIRSGKKTVYFIAFFPISHAEQKPSLYFPARSRRVFYPPPRHDSGRLTLCTANYYICIGNALSHFCRSLATQSSSAERIYFTRSSRRVFYIFFLAIPLNSARVLVHYFPVVVLAGVHELSIRRSL